MLEVNDKRLRRELAEYRERLEHMPEDTLLLQAVARTLRWLGEPEAEEVFELAASRLEESERIAESRGMGVDPYSALGVGDYNRLAGNQDRARYWYERIYSDLNEQYQRSELEFNDTRYYAEVLFLLGRYDEYVSLRDHWAIEDEDDFETALTTRLCRAFLAGDVPQLEQILEEWVEHIRKYRLKPSDTGFALHPWDRYEIALRRKAEMEGRAVATLGPRELLQQEKEWQEQQEQQPPTEEPPSRRRLTKEQVRKIVQEEDEQPDLYRTDLSGLDLTGEPLTVAVLVEADLRNADLTNADLIEADLSGADLRGANLQGAQVQQAILNGARLDPDALGRVEDKNLAYVELSGTDLRGFDLSGMDLREAVLIETDLREANLRDADFSGADLTGADLRGANTEGADFDYAVMEDVLR